MAQKTKKDLIKSIRIGVRLNTKAPKKETPKTVYNRKDKHKGRLDTSSYQLMTA